MLSENKPLCKTIGPLSFKKDQPKNMKYPKILMKNEINIVISKETDY